MLQVEFTRIPPGVSPALLQEGAWGGLPAASYRDRGVALRHLAGEALARRFIRARGHDGYEIRRGEKGKPYVTGVEGLFFNISHSGDYVVAAFSDREVGIDIEQRGRARVEVATRFFHPAEIAALLAAGEEERKRLFIDYWAIKESYLKYLGTGLTRPLSTFRVEIAPAGIHLHDERARLPLHVHPCRIDEAYSCFTCSETSSPPLVTEIGLPDLYSNA